MTNERIDNLQCSVDSLQWSVDILLDRIEELEEKQFISGVKNEAYEKGLLIVSRQLGISKDELDRGIDNIDKRDN